MSESVSVEENRILFMVLTHLKKAGHFKYYNSRG